MPRPSDCPGSDKGAAYFLKNGAKLKRLEDVRTGDAIVFKSGEHIALIDRITETGRAANKVYAVSCMVAESTADQMLDGGPDDGWNSPNVDLIRFSA